jgi:hypothetical protein
MLVYVKIFDSLVMYGTYGCLCLCLLNESILIKLNNTLFVNSIFVLFLRLSSEDIIFIR